MNEHSFSLDYSDIMAEADKQFEGEQLLSEPNVYVSLTYDALDAKVAMDRVKSPKAGAVVLFAGKVFSIATLVTLTDQKQ